MFLYIPCMAQINLSVSASSFQLHSSECRVSHTHTVVFYCVCLSCVLRPLGCWEKRRSHLGGAEIVHSPRSVLWDRHQGVKSPSHVGFRYPCPKEPPCCSSQRQPCGRAPQVGRRPPHSHSSAARSLLFGGEGISIVVGRAFP